MDISKQVCTLEQAKKLSQMGISQNSFLEHCKKVNRDWYIRNRPTIDTADFKETYAAYSVAELGMMLSTIEYEAWGFSILMCWYSHTEEKWSAGLRNVRDEKYKYTGSAETEAESRAGLLIYLIENGFTTSVEVNEKLN